MPQVLIEKIPVYLTPDECEQFITFQKHRALIGFLESIGFFKLRGGSVQIHVDPEGRLAGADKVQHFRA